MTDKMKLIILYVILLLLFAIPHVQAYSGTEGNYVLRLVTPIEFSDALHENDYVMSLIVNPGTSGHIRTEGSYKLRLNIYNNGMGGMYSEGGYRLYIVPDQAYVSYSCGITANDPLCTDPQNQVPAVDAGPDATINEGSTFTGSGWFTDSDSSFWAATVDYGNGTGVQLLPLNPDKSFSLTYTYADNGTYTVVVTVFDNQGDSGSDTAVITVNNVAPTVNAGADKTAFEGDLVGFSGSFTDPGSADTHRIRWNFGDGATVSRTLTPTHVYNSDGIYTVSLTVTDDDGGTGTDTMTVNVQEYSGSEGGYKIKFVILRGYSDIPQENDYNMSFLVSSATSGYLRTEGNYKLGLNLYATGIGGAYNEDGYKLYLVPDQAFLSYKCDITVNDPSCTGTPPNTAPIVEAGTGATINEGGTYTGSGSFTDQDADTWTATVDYADGSGVKPLALSGKTFSLSHTYADNGTYTITVNVTDDDSGFGMDTAAVTVNNVAPTATFNAPTSVNEGSPILLSLTTPSDPSIADTSAGFQYAFDCGDGSGYGASGSSSSTTCSTNNNGARTVKGKILDKDNGVTEYSATVNVNNVAPTVTITGPSAGSVFALGNVTFIGTYSDPGTSDTHIANWTFDSLKAPPQSVSSGLVSTRYKFTAAGVYSVKLTVTDDDGEIGTATTAGGQDAYIVVYDPSAGFVTGGGWINSSAGAYAADPMLTGRANFGFVSKYQKGANTPTGQTEFQFKAGSLNFHSTIYQWLVVAGAKAQYKGSGTINGTGDYGFLLTATDGQLSGGGGVDKFRIKIVDKATGAVVYDNVPGGSDDMDTANPQAIGGGSIVIHK